jgi:hypothetical protein
MIFDGGRVFQPVMRAGVAIPPGKNLRDFGPSTSRLPLSRVSRVGTDGRPESADPMIPLQESAMTTRRRRDLRPGFDHLDGRILLSAGLTPAQVRQAYSENYVFNVNGRSYTADGTKQTIAIVIGGLDPYISNDLATFDQAYGIPAPPSFQSVYFQGAQYNETANAIEETSLDVEWAHAVAPGANILLVQAVSMSNADLMNAVNYARNQPGVSVVSMSWDSPESTADLQYNSIFTTPAGHTGVTFVAAADDNGYFNTHQGTQVGADWPASVPTVLSVGGTTLSTNANGTYLGETAWNLNYQGSNGWWGGGGGYSGLYAEPSYQAGVQRTGVRTVPDVSYNAGTGVQIYDSLAGGWQTVDGTSAGTPQWAGLIAEVNEGRWLAGLNPLDGASQTLPGVYQFASAFRDVTVGSNGYSAGRGYDLATGLGTPVASVLAGDLAFQVSGNYLATHAATASPALLPSAGGGSSIGMGMTAAIAGPTRELAPVGRPDADADTVASSTDTMIIALSTSVPMSASATGHRHDRFDLALGSLLDADFAFLMS